MATIGSYELKTNLARFLDRVVDGEVIEITRHGAVVAKLVPTQPQSTYKKKQATDLLKQLKRVKLKGASIQSLIQDGRKH